MIKIKSIAANLGLGLACVYGFFSIPSIAELFKPSFLILLKQTLAMAFAVCILLNPRQLIEAGAEMAPKINAVFNIFFKGGPNKKDEL